MSLNKWASEEEFLRETDRRVMEIVSYGKRECPDGVCPIELYDFLDLHFNAGGFITLSNEPYCGRYYRHQMECWGQGFSCVTDWDIGLVH